MEIYKNSTLSVSERVEDLLSKMTLKEKLSQLRCGGCLITIEEFYKDSQNGIDSMDSEIYSFKDFDVTLINKLQKFAVEKTRLGIPLFFAVEGQHGVSLPFATIFPTAGCVSATFDDDLAYRMAVAEAKEGRAIGVNKMYAPNVDISQDARWGRSEENFGEDPYLTGKMGASMVRGLQENGICATVKHYLAYGTPERGLNLSPTHMGERDVREYMLPPFRECIKAGAMGIMPSYSELDGIPLHISKYWMKDVLRDELGFDGVVITDYGANGLIRSKRCISSDRELGELFLDAMINMEACSPVGYQNKEFIEGIEKGEIDVKRIDELVRQVLQVKFKLGLFENPYFDEENWKEKVYTKEHRALSYEIASKGITMLKNDGVLPFKKENIKIALVGPNGNIAQVGNYCYNDYSFDPDKKVSNSVFSRTATLFDGLKKVFGDQNVTFEQGVGFATYNKEKVQKALDICKTADVIIFAGGQNSIGKFGGDQSDENEISTTSSDAPTSGEGYDTASTDLSIPQKNFVKKLAKLGKPIVGVLYGGKPTSITDELPLLNAVLLGYGIGSDGNYAMADIIKGTVCPSGKLPFSVPRSAGHIPCYYNRKEQGGGNQYKRHGSYDTPGMDYVFDNPFALFEFGYGLSYTNFEYSNFTAKKVGESIKCKVSIANTGDMDGDESVLVFGRNMRTKVVTAIFKKLVYFKRISLKKGEKKDLEFEIPFENFYYVGVDMKMTAPTESIKLMMANQEIFVEI